MTAPRQFHWFTDFRFKPLTVQFSDASTGMITSRLWNFGDAQTSTQQNQ
jgi:PKD repeat protein